MDFSRMTIAKETLDALIALSVVLGLLYCFLGYKIFKILLGILGFAVGAVLGGALAYGSSGGEGGATLIAALLAGLVGAALFVALYFVGVFVLGAGTVALLGTIFFQAYGSGTPSAELILVLAIIGGILAVILQKFVIIVSTAFLGSWTVVTGVFYFTESHSYRIIAIRNSAGLFPPRAHLGVIIVLWILLGIAGVVVQFRRTEKDRQKKTTESPDNRRSEDKTRATDGRTASAQLVQEERKDPELLEEKAIDNKREFLIPESRLHTTQVGNPDEKPEPDPAGPDEDEYNF